MRRFDMDFLQRTRGSFCFPSAGLSNDAHQLVTAESIGGMRLSRQFDQAETDSSLD